MITGINTQWWNELYGKEIATYLSGLLMSCPGLLYVSDSIISSLNFWTVAKKQGQGSHAKILWENTFGDNIKCSYLYEI